MNWKQLVEADNARIYVLPEGWDTKEKIAQQLGCSEDSVRKHLAPALKARRVEVREFPVWDSVLKRLRRVTAYRQIHAKK